MRIKKVFLFALLFVLFAFGSGFKAEAAGSIGIGKSKTGIFEGFLDETEYTVKVPRTMKVKFTLVLSKRIASEDDYWDGEIDDDSVLFSLYNPDDYESCDDIFSKSVSAGKTYSKTVTLKKGKYLLSLYNGDAKVKYKVAVKDVSKYTTKIKLNKSKHTMYVKNSVKLKATSKVKNCYIKTVTWKSSNKKIATVSSSGKVTAKKAGTCTISAKVKGGKTVKCKITVKKRPAIYIKEFEFDLDYVGGVEPYFKIENNTGKTIKYIYTKVYCYNAVGDPARCEIRGTNYRNLEMVGPLKNGKTSTYYFDPIIYDGTTTKIKIKSVTVKFMNNTKKTYKISKSAKY